MKTIVTFGEIMARLSPHGWLKLRQTLPGTLDATFAGAKANVAVSIAYLGGSARFVTALPDNDLTDACLAHSIQGDFNSSTRAEAEAVMRGSVSGRVVR